MIATIKMKALFFDTAKVKRAMDKGTRRALAKIGAFLRKDARQLLRVSKKSAAPGRPPHIRRAGSPLKTLLEFGADLVNQNVVVGPRAFKVPAKVPGVLEFGGKVSVPIRNRRKRRVRRVVKQAARPYMSPTLLKNITKLPAQWRNSVRGNG